MASAIETLPHNAASALDRAPLSGLEVVNDTLPHSSQSSALPEYMVPSAYLNLTKLELPNRKGLKTSQGKFGLYEFISDQDYFAAQMLFDDHEIFNGKGERRKRPNRPDIPLDTIDIAVATQALTAHAPADAVPGSYPHQRGTLDWVMEEPMSDDDRRNAVFEFATITKNWGGNLGLLGEVMEKQFEKEEEKKEALLMAALSADPAERLEAQFAYFGRKDVTPNTIRLIGQARMSQQLYRLHYPDGLDFPKEDILDRKVKHQSGIELTYRESMIMGYESIMHSITHSDLGLVEFEYNTDKSMQNQYLRDSATSLMFDDGTMPNRKKGVAEVGVQGANIDALLMGDALLTPEEMHRAASVDSVRAVLEKPRVRDRFSEKELEAFQGELENPDVNTFGILAKVMQRQVLSRFWMEDSQYFAAAIQTGGGRKIDSLASNAGYLLGTGIFDDLPPDEREKYVGGIGRMLMSDQFLTDAGIRARAVKYDGILGFDDYHGHMMVWGPEQSLIVEGFLRQGLVDNALEIAYRRVNAFNIGRDNKEFIPVLADGRVIYDPRNEMKGALSPNARIVILKSTNEPEKNQLFSGVYREKYLIGNAHLIVRDETSRNYVLDKQIVSRVKHITPLVRKAEVETATPHDMYIIYDITGAKEQDRRHSNWWQQFDEQTLARLPQESFAEVGGGGG